MDTTGSNVPSDWDFDKSARGNRVVKFQKWHLEIMERDKLQLGISVGFGDYRGYILGMSNLGPTFTALDETGVASVFGCVVPWPGLGEAWMIADREKITKHPRATLEVGRTFSDNCLKRLSLRRLQMYIMSDEKIVIQYAKALRFVQETVYPLRKYGPDGKDYHLFVRFQDERNCL
jgi:hypothetical protein